MFKKILCIALAVMMIMSVAMIGASAAQVEIVENSAEVPAEVGADGENADTGSSNMLYFDAKTTGWNLNNVKYISFYIWVIDGDAFTAWGAKSTRSQTKDAVDGVYSYDLDAKGIELVSGTYYGIIFAADTGVQTYNLLMTTDCIGHTAYCDGTTYENPEDSQAPQTLAAFWEGIDSSVCGPELKITSIGNVVGTCLAGTSPIDMFNNFLTSDKGFKNAQTYAGKDDQQIIDDTAAALKIGKKDVKEAIAASGVTIAWDESKSTLAEESDDSANNGGNGSSGNSGNSSKGNSGSTSTTGTKSNTSTSKTGQETTVLFVMLGVMVAAAGVIFFARKRERA